MIFVNVMILTHYFPCLVMIEIIEIEMIFLVVRDDFSFIEMIFLTVMIEMIFLTLMIKMIFPVVMRDDFPYGDDMQR